MQPTKLSSNILCCCVVQDCFHAATKHKGWSEVHIHKRHTRQHCSSVEGKAGSSIGRARATSWLGLLPQVDVARRRSEEHTSELQSLMRISYAVFCLKKKKKTRRNT